MCSLCKHFVCISCLHSKLLHFSLLFHFYVLVLVVCGMSLIVKKIEYLIVNLMYRGTKKVAACDLLLVVRQL